MFISNSHNMNINMSDILQFCISFNNTLNITIQFIEFLTSSDKVGDLKNQAGGKLDMK